MIDKEYLNERYKIVKLLGQGGMSKVYLAENIKLGTLWAIKEIKKNSGLNVDFLVEPNMLKKLNHPALPKIFDIFEDDENVYIVVDYIEGVALDKKLDECVSFPEPTVLDWARQLCGVLSYLHANSPNPIIYRDMKPSNIILCKTGSLKLIDFGVAREYKTDCDSDTVYIGTRGYAAPEQYGSGQTSAATDIYSLGVTLYHLLTGRSPNDPPYEIKAVRYFSKNFSEEIEEIIKKCTKQNPSERYSSIEELLTDIDKAEKKALSQKARQENDCELEKERRVRPFKKLVLTIWGNSEFGCEFAYTAAKQSSHTVLLCDLDLLAPKADIYLNMKKYPERMINEGEFLKSGIDIAFEGVEKNYLTPELIADASIKRKDLKNLYVLTGSYKIENYEYYNDKCLIKLIEKAYLGFDLTILLVNKSIYDSFTMISLGRSDYNIAAISANLDMVRETNSYIAFLYDKHKLPMEKTKFIAFEYEADINLDMQSLMEVSQGNFIGKIRQSRRRKIYRNLKASYAAKMEKEIVNDYLSILRRFNIVPSEGLFRKLHGWVLNTFASRRLA